MVQGLAPFHAKVFLGVLLLVQPAPLCAQAYLGDGDGLELPCLALLWMNEAINEGLCTTCTRMREYRKSHTCAKRQRGIDTCAKSTEGSYTHVQGAHEVFTHVRSVR